MSKELKQKAIQKYKEHLEDPNYFENSEEESYYTGFFDGYHECQKEHEWHYVKDEKDLPTDKKEYLLLLGSNIRTFGFYNGRFWESWKGDFSWQEVKAYFSVPVPELPKEIE